MLKSMAEIKFPLLGRTDEISSILLSLKKVVAEKKSHFIKIDADSGLGITFLLETLESKIKENKAFKDQNILFLKGHCYPTYDETFPYSIVRNLILDYYDRYTRKNSVVMLYDIFGDKTVALFPEVDRILKGFESKFFDNIFEKGSIKDQHDDLCDKVIDNLDNIISDKLTVILLDDIQWLDEYSIDLLEKLMSRLKNRSILFCMGMHPSKNIEKNKKITNKFFKDRASTIVLNLKNINSQNLSTYCEDNLLKYIQDRTNFNPFYSVKALKLLASRGYIYYKDGVWKALPDINEVNFIESGEGFLDLFLNGFTDLQRQIIKVASSFRDVFDSEIIANVIDRTYLEIAEEMNEICRTTDIFVYERKKYFFRYNIFKKYIQNSITEELKSVYMSKLGNFYMKKNIRNKFYSLNEAIYYYYRSFDKKLFLLNVLTAAKLALDNFYFEDAKRCYFLATYIIDDFEPGKNKDLKLIDIHMGLANSLRLLGDWQNSIKVLEKALPTAKQSSNILKEADIYFALSEAYILKGDFIKAIENIKLAGTIYGDYGDKKGKFKSNNILGEICYLNADYEAAIVYYKENTKLAADDKKTFMDKDLLDTTYRGLGKVYYRKNFYQDAIEQYLACINIYQKIKYIDGLADTYHYLGMAYYKQGSFDKAVSFYTKAILAFQRIKDVHNENRASTSLGVVYFNSGEWDKALKYFDKAFYISKKLNLNKGIALLAGNIGKIYTYRGNFEKAYEFLKINLDKAEEHNLEMSKMFVYNDLGEMYVFKGDYDQAKKYFEDSLKISIKKKFYDSVVNSLSGLVDVYIAKEHYEASQKYISEINKILEKIKDKSVLAKVYFTLGKYFFAKGELSKCQPNFDESLKIYNKLQYKYNIAEVQYYYFLFLKKSDVSEAQMNSFKEDSEILFKDLNCTYYLEKLKGAKEDSTPFSEELNELIEEEAISDEDLAAELNNKLKEEEVILENKDNNPQSSDLEIDETSPFSEEPEEVIERKDGIYAQKPEVAEQMINPYSDLKKDEGTSIVSIARLFKRD